MELPLTIDEALRFTISGGVLIPAEQSLEEGNGLGLPGQATLTQEEPPRE